eukprot:scaffold130371_cov40-Cyclotella_meneghiniana.AAC.4
MNLLWLQSDGYFYYSMILEYIFAVTVSSSYVILLKGAALLWKLWIVEVSFYWWLLAFYKYLTDQPYVPFEWFERKRPRRAVRKLFPGFSRKYVMSIHPAWIPPTHTQNAFRAAIKNGRWTSHMHSLPEAPKFCSLRDYDQWLWSDYCSAPIFEEINIMMTSLFMMTLYRLYILLLLLVQRRDFLGILRLIVRYSRIPFRFFFGAFDRASSYIASLFMYKDQFQAQEVFASVPMNRKVLHSLRSKYWSRTRMALTTVYNLDQRVQDLTGSAVTFDSDANFVVCDNSANTHICNDKSMFTELRPIVDQSTVATIGGKNSRPTGIGTVKWSWDDV